MLVTHKSKSLILYSFLLFMLSAIYGLLLRWNFTFPTQLVNYKNLLQGHSHVAFLGWGYLVATVVLIKLYIPNYIESRKLYLKCFGISTLTITLMLVSFPLVGYKAFSIVLLSIFGITSFVLSVKILKDLLVENTAGKLVKYGIYYYLISSLATWGIAITVATQGKTSLYYNLIYFYLHFLYNGFFVFVLFGILFKILSNQEIIINEKHQKLFFRFLNLACIPAYSLSVLWSTNNPIFYLIGFVAAFLQIIALFFLLKILKQILLQIDWCCISTLLLKFAIYSYVLKVIIQVFSSFPYFVIKSLALKPFLIIGYLHLFTLSFMSVLLILILHKIQKIYFKSFSAKFGVYLFLFGILVTETLLFLQGFLILIKLTPLINFNLFMLIFSFFMVVGLFLIFINQFKKHVLVSI